MSGSRGKWLALLLVLFSIGTAGCATVDQKVSLAYAPVTGVTGGSGVLYLAASGRTEHVRESAVEWVLGPVKNGDGERTGEILSRVPPEEYIIHALRTELAAAGYQVLEVPAPPPGLAKGADLTRLVLSLQVVRTPFTATGSSTVEFDLDLWRNGQKLKKLRYNLTLTDTTASDKDLVATKVLDQSLRQIMRQSVPEIVRSLEQGS